MPIKVKGYTFVKKQNKRNQKRFEAEARNKLWAQLSPNEQVKLLEARNGQSKRQIARIKNFNTNR